MVMILMCCFLISPPVGEDSLGDVKVDYTCANFTDQLLKSMDMVDVQIPIWIINLKRDVARRDFMVEQLERLGLAYELIEAVDGSTLTDEDMSIISPELSEQRIYRQLTRGEIGCALSHIRLWERIVREDIPEALIFEDDVLIGRNMVDILLNREKLPQDWEHINFTAWARVVPFGDFIFDIYRAAKFLERPFSSSAYLLTKSGAEKLLETVYPLYIPIDDYFSISGLNSYGVEPQVAALMQFGTSIGQRLRATKPKPKFWKRKHREFIEMIRAILIFCGIRSEWIVAANAKLRALIGSSQQRD